MKERIKTKSRTGIGNTPGKIAGKIAAGRAGIALAVILLLTPLTVFSEEAGEPVPAADEIKPSELYARSAVLMDAGSGRILYSKNGTEEMPMASTTKILTCILALERGDPEAEVPVSGEAASQPAVKLVMREGQSFILRDLLFSLMLESHNDTAVAIAESVGGSVEGFADMMNDKAEELGCTDSYFITPNGLDASDARGIHHTTAEDLARIMRYCIMLSEQKEAFLEITRTETYAFTDCQGISSYSCVNHNTFLKMMDGALTGKTGFTADAGYCYVGALKRDDRTFIAALLACGWPDNKGYKWSDMRKLMDYALEYYEYRVISPPSPGGAEGGILVKNGSTGGFPAKEPVKIRTEVRGTERKILLRTDETVEEQYHLPSYTEAPLEKGTRVGSVVCSVKGETIAVYPVLAAESVAKRSLSVCMSYLVDIITL